jgi:hypothetical protein
VALLCCCRAWLLADVDSTDGGCSASSTFAIDRARGRAGYNPASIFCRTTSTFRSTNLVSLLRSPGIPRLAPRCSYTASAAASFQSDGTLPSTAIAVSIPGSVWAAGGSHAILARSWTILPVPFATRDFRSSSSEPTTGSPSGSEEEEEEEESGCVCSPDGGWGSSGAVFATTTCRAPADSAAGRCDGYSTSGCSCSYSWGQGHKGEEKWSLLEVCYQHSCHQGLQGGTLLSGI